MIMDLKKCTECGESKEIAEFYKNYASCKECVKKQAREYRKRPEVKERNKAYGKEYRSRPKVKKQRNARKRKYSKTEDFKEKRRQYTNLYQQELKDGYIRNLLIKQSDGILNTEDIPENLIIVKRQSVKLKRLIKSKNDEQ